MGLNRVKFMSQLLGDFKPKEPDWEAYYGDYKKGYFNIRTIARLTSTTPAEVLRIFDEMNTSSRRRWYDFLGN